jgi:nucleoside-diphosphate-sugar epimerase
MAEGAPSGTLTPTLVVGLGYSGARLARVLREEGVAVAGTTRDAARAEALRAEGIDARVVDLEEEAGRAALDRLVPEGGAVVHTAPPTGADPMRDAGARAVAAACRTRRPKVLIYLSTTGVYAEKAGGRVDEESPVDAASPRAAPRLDAEAAFLEAGEAIGARAVVFRLPGIYGPGRGLARRVKEGRVRLWDGGHNWLNRIHVEDIVQYVVAALRRPPPSGVYNLADERPTTLREHALWIADRLGLPPPPEAPREAAPSPTLTGSKRVDATRIRRALPEVSLRYPSFVEGFDSTLEED